MIIEKGGTLGEQLRVIREEQEISLRDMAKKLGMSHTFLYHLEQNNRMPKNLQAIADAYGVSIVHLEKFDFRIPKKIKKVILSDKEVVRAFKRMSNSFTETKLRQMLPDIRSSMNDIYSKNCN